MHWPMLFAAALFGGSLVLTILGFFPIPWVQTLKKFDYFSLIPNWAFFSRAQSELRLSFRTVSGLGEWSGWTEIDVVGTRNWHEAFWHPRKRVERAFQIDLGTIAQRWRRGVDRHKLEASIRYRRIDGQVRNVCGRDAKYEFVIAMEQRFEGRKAEMLVFRSGLHDASGGPC